MRTEPMAIYHLRAKIISRRKGQSTVAGAAYRSGGHSATHAAAYRSGERLTDERTGRTFDYGRKQGIVHTEILAPENAPAWVYDRTQLWNTVERTEKRKDAQLAREIEISLPRELSHEQQVELVRSFVKEQFVKRGMIADVAMHCPKATDGKDQPHAHIMLTLRPLKPDNSGFGNKERDWNKPELLGHWREQWAVFVNQALADSSNTARIDHRTLEAQGIPRAPLPYLPLPVVTGKFRQISAELTGRMNQRNTVRFRKLALEILNAVQGSDRIAWGIMAATEEEAGRYPVSGGGRDYVPQR
jgi:ATP-dependent exoDNAse (exonuclease V) alpha subunit